MASPFHPGRRPRQSSRVASARAALISAITRTDHSRVFQCYQPLHWQGHHRCLGGHRCRCQLRRRERAKGIRDYLGSELPRFRAWQAALQACGGDGGTRGRVRRARGSRQRQDVQLGAQGRRRGRDRRHPLLRRLGGQDSRKHHRDDEGQAIVHRSRTPRCRRSNHPLELSMYVPPLAVCPLTEC